MLTRRPSDDRLEIADEVSLIEVPEPKRQIAHVPCPSLGDLLGSFVHAV